MPNVMTELVDAPGYAINICASNGDGAYKVRARRETSVDGRTFVVAEVLGFQNSGTPVDTSGTFTELTM